MYVVDTSIALHGQNAKDVISVKEGRLKVLKVYSAIQSLS